MTKRDQLKEVLQKFVGTDDKTLSAFQDFNKATQKLQSDLKEKIQIATLDKVNGQLSEFQNRIDFTPFLDALSILKNEIVSRDTQLSTDLQNKLEGLRGELSDARGSNKDSSNSLQDQISSLESQLLEVSARKFPEFPDFLTPIKDSETRIMTLVNNLEKYDDKVLKKEIAAINDALYKLRIDLIERINNKGGGAMNRQMFINSVDPLLKYTDVNLKNGSNVTITYQNNDTTKKVDITIAATGGGGGSTRVIASVAVNTLAGSTAGVDYVYLCSGTITITMPTTVGNTNLYTIKNIGAGVITINTTGGETIDGDPTVIIPVQFTSVDLISNNSGNWNIT